VESHLDSYFQKYQQTGNIYYKSTAHFLHTYTNKDTGLLVASFYKTDYWYGFDCYFNFPSMKYYQTAILYYHYDGIGKSKVLDHIELLDQYFIIGDYYRTMDSLSLKDIASLTGDLLLIVLKNEYEIEKRKILNDF
jgi:hypothetical protein